MISYIIYDINMIPLTPSPPSCSSAGPSSVYEPAAVPGGGRVVVLSPLPQLAAASRPTLRKQRRGQCLTLRKQRRGQCGTGGGSTRRGARGGALASAAARASPCGNSGGVSAVNSIRTR